MIYSDSDSILVRRALAGDRLSADCLVERHRRQVTAIAYQSLRDADDAHDVAQEVMVYAMLRLHDLRDSTRFSSWLRRITLSLCSDYRRRRGTRRLGEPIDILNEAGEEARLLENLLLREAIQALSNAQQEAFLLHAGGWTVKEAAHLLGIPENTLRSRLAGAKRCLRSGLKNVFEMEKPLPTPTDKPSLSRFHTSLLDDAFPGSRIDSILAVPEVWMPFAPRVRLTLADGSEKTVDFREDIDPIRAELLALLERLGISGPRLIHGPVRYGKRSEEIARTPYGRVSQWRYLCLCEPPYGENLHLWAMGGTPHRIRVATECTHVYVDRLHAVTDALAKDPLSDQLPRRTLVDEVAAIEEVGDGWISDQWFQSALSRVKEAAGEIATPLAYTDYLFFHPGFHRIEPGPGPFDAPLGWPGDDRLTDNHLVETVSPFGYFGDPLLGLAMVWIYDCYPFVHAGFVEQYLWRREVSRREFAPRLAIKALQILQREIPIDNSEVNTEYYAALRGYVEQSLEWM